MYIPNEAEMEALLPIPSEAEMEALFAGVVKKVKTPKPKAPCKYGPRDENGHCPKKPPAEKKTKVSKTAATFDGASLGQKVIVESAKEFSQQAARNLKPRITKKQMAATTRAAIGEVKKAGAAAAGAVGKGITAAKGAAAAAGATIASAGAGGIAAMLAVGTGTFLGVQWLRAKMDDAIERRRYEQSPNRLFQDAEKRYQVEKQRIEKDLGRKLTTGFYGSEDHQLFTQFMAPIEQKMMEFLQKQ